MINGFFFWQFTIMLNLKNNNKIVPVFNNQNTSNMDEIAKSIFKMDKLPILNENIT